LPAVKRNISFTLMPLAFQMAIFISRTEGHIPQDTIRVVFAEIITAMLNGFGLSSLDALVIPSPPTTGPGSYYHRQSAPVLDTERSRNIAILLCHCQTLHLITKLNLLISNLAEESKITQLDRFELMFFPFMQTLGSTIQELNLSTELSPLRSLFQQVLNTYIERYVGPEQQLSNDWPRPRIVCDCQHCPSLNAFLTNPNQQICSFRMNCQKRDHLYSEVSDTGIDHIYR
jgi:hypothetical protein